MASKWDLNRESIKELYVDQRMILDDVMLIMKVRGFIASKKSYERHLNKWGIRKNVDKKAMTSLKIRLELRKRRGLESLVLFKGTQLSDLELEQATSRCFVPSSVHPKDDRKLPPGMTVITPTSEGYMVSIRNQYLPFIYFLNRLPPTKHLQQLIFMPPQILERIISAIANGRGDRSLQESQGLARIHRLLSAVLPVEEDEHSLDVLRCIISGSRDTASIELLKIVVFLLSNKHLYKKSQHLICDELLEWFQMGDNYLFLKSILPYKMPTIEAFAEGIFTSAINAGDRRVVSLSLDCGMCSNVVVDDCSGPYSGKCSALQLAIASGHYDIVKLLLEFHADSHYSKYWGHSINGQTLPLGISIRTGNMPITRLIIAKGASIHSGDDEYGATALHWAASSGNTEAATLLLDMGADTNAQCSRLGSPLECAISKNAISMVDLLLKRGASVNGPSDPLRRTPLQLAATLDDADLVKRLLHSGANADAPAHKCFRCNKYSHCSGVHMVSTALQGAAENGSVQICQILLDCGASINAAPIFCTVHDRKKGITSLVAAIRSGNLDLVKLFLCHGADVNDERGTHTALEAALNAKHPAILQIILSAHPRLNNFLCSAIETRNTVLIETFLEAGADINGIQRHVAENSSEMQSHGSSTQWCALSKAVALGDKECVKLLLRLGAWPQPEPGGPDVVIPLVEAAYRADISMIAILLAAGANLDMQENNVSREETDENGRESWKGYLSLNALQTVSRYGNLELARHFLNLGADINMCAAQSNGRTALQAAVESRNIELIHFLIEKGADLNGSAARYSGITALQAAVSTQDKSCVIMLLAKGAHLDGVAPAKCEYISLCIAAENGDDEMLVLLLNLGAQINRPSKVGFWGFTPLQGAVRRGHWSTVRLLLANGADVNVPACKEYGLTALQAAASGGYLHIADILVQNGADLNVAGSLLREGSALELAAVSGRIDMLKFLLNAGADTVSDLGQARFKNAIKLATANGHHAAAKFLRYHQVT